jgi:uncharacterized RDD family membrane protein YckC
MRIVLGWLGLTDGDFDIDGGEFVGGIIIWGVVVVYFTYLESTGPGATLGKAVFKIRVADPGGGLPSRRQAFVRNAWMLLGIIPFLGGLAMIALAIVIAVAISSSPEGIGTHDQWAGGTHVLTGGPV